MRRVWKVTSTRGGRTSIYDTMEAAFLDMDDKLRYWPGVRITLTSYVEKNS